MKKLSNLDIASILVLFNFVLLIIFGTVYSILGTFMSYHEAFIGITAEDVSTFNSNLMVFIGILIRGTGFCFIFIGIAGSIIIYFGFRKKEKWAWLVIVLALLLMNIPLIAFTYIITGPLSMVSLLNIVGAILGIIALILSYKEIFRE